MDIATQPVACGVDLAVKVYLRAVAVGMRPASLTVNDVHRRAVLLPFWRKIGLRRVAARRIRVEKELEGQWHACMD